MMASSMLAAVLVLSQPLSAQRLALSELPEGLRWSEAAVDSTGQVAYLLSSPSAGTYFVLGDSASYLSQTRFVVVSAADNGWQVSLPPSGEYDFGRADSLVSADGTQLTGSAGYASGSIGSRRAMDGRRVRTSRYPAFLDTETPTPFVYTVAGANGRGLLPFEAARRRVTTDERAGTDFEFKVVRWAIGRTHVAIAERISTFNVYLPGGTWSYAASLASRPIDEGGSARTFTELSAPPVSLVGLGQGFALLSSREIVLVDTLMRELQHAYWPRDEKLIRAASSVEQLFLIDDGPDKRGRLTVLDTGLNVLAQYVPELIADTLTQVSVELASQRVFIAGRSSTGYFNAEVLGGRFEQAGLERVTSGIPVLAKADYPLPDTIAAVSTYRRNFRIEGESLGPLTGARVLADSSLHLTFDAWTEVRGASGQWLGNWSPDTSEYVRSSLVTGRFRAVGDSIVYDGADGTRLLAKGSTYLRYYLAGSTSPGFALILAHSVPLRGVQTVRYSIIDSLGRVLVTPENNVVAGGVRTSLYPVGLLLSGSYTGFGTGREPIGLSKISYTPSTLLGMPLQAPIGVCRIGEQIDFEWPGAEGYTSTFRYDGQGYYSGSYYGAFYNVPTRPVLNFNEAVTNLNVVPVCGDLLAGNIMVELDSQHPPVDVFIDGNAGTERTYTGYANAEILLSDTAGCQAIRRVIVREVDFEPRIVEACAGEPYGSIALLTSGTDESILSFDDGNFIDERDSLNVGTYQVQLLTSSGCVYDTLITIAEAPPAIPTLDSTARGGDYDVLATDTDSVYWYTYAWSNGEVGDMATLTAASEHSVFTTQRSYVSPQQVCFDTLTFTLGDGISRSTHPLLQDLKVWVNGNDLLTVDGLMPLMRTGEPHYLTLHDVTGQTLLSTPITSPRVQLQRGEWPRGIVFVRLDRYGSIGVLW